MQIGQQIAQLPKDYFEGTQRARTRAMQTAFPDGMPKNPDGTPDINKIIDVGTKLGGLEYAQPLMSMLMQQQTGRQAAEGLGNLDASVNGQPNGSAAGPANLTPRPQAPPQQQPQLSSAGADNKGADTLSSLASETGMDLGPLLPRIAQSLGVHPADPLTPDQAGQAKAILSRAAQLARAQGGRNGAGDGAPPVTSAGTSGAPGPTGAEGPQAAAPASGIVPTAPQGAPQAPQPSAPQSAPAAPGPQAPGPAISTPVAGGSPAAAAVVPPGTDPQDMIRKLQTAAARATAYAARVGKIDPQAAAAATKQAEFYEGRAKLIQEAITKDTALTDPQKNATASGVKSPLEYENKKKQNETDIARYAKVHGGLQAAASTADQLLHYTQLGKGILKDKNVYFGSGEQLNLAFKKLKNVFDPNNTESLAQEAYRKTTAAMVLAQVNQMKDEASEVGGGGRIFQQQIELMEKAAGDPNTSAPALRLLTEVAERGAKTAKEVNRLANAYAKKNGRLDEGFSDQLSKYYEDHPMFKPYEMKDIRMISPLEFDSPKEAHDAGLPSGYPIKIKGAWHKAP
jgi:hypothetical protein